MGPEALSPNGSCHLFPQPSSPVPRIVSKGDSGPQGSSGTGLGFPVPPAQLFVCLRHSGMPSPGSLSRFSPSTTVTTAAFLLRGGRGQPHRDHTARAQPGAKLPGSHCPCIQHTSTKQPGALPECNRTGHCSEQPPVESRCEPGDRPQMRERKRACSATYEGK